MRESLHAKERQGKIFVLSGPSGSGKTTLRDKLFESKVLKNKLTKSVSLTTRKKRSGERSGRDYFFTSPAAFKQLLRRKKILEWTKYLGYHYATPRDFAQKQIKKGKHIVLCLDIKGALRIKKLYPKNSVLIFIKVPSLKALRKRIEGRCNKTKREEIKKRLMLAERELLEAKHYDYRLMNREFHKALTALEGIILKETNSR